jgi:hypothetical protein
LAWWGTLAGLAALLIGLAVFVFYALSEVVANPGVSLVDGYWIGRLPWTGIAEGFTVVGATATVVLGMATVWMGGVRWNSILALIALAVAGLWWLASIFLAHMLGAPCSPCEPLPFDPFAYAYSQPENAVILLLVPAAVMAGLAFSARKGQRG